jgi:hypothetical protein
VNNYVWNSFVIHPAMLARLIRYRDDHIPTGSFLEAVLSNDLRWAVESGDAVNLANLPAFPAWCYNHLPSEAWGSPTAYRNWVYK